jgi:hypothetical protein
LFAVGAFLVLIGMALGTTIVSLLTARLSRR